MFTHLLVPTDGSALSDAAIQMAVKLARENKARLTALHVMPPFHVITYDTEMLSDTQARLAEIAAQNAETWLAAVARQAGEAGVECETVAVTRDHPYEAIIDTATQRQCDLVVMASHGRSGMRGLLIGSETQKVLTHSDIPVLVVRPPMSSRTRHQTEAGESADTSSPQPPQPFITLRA